MKQLLLVLIFTLSLPTFSEAPNCQIILDNSSSETLSLANSLDIPYGNSCLTSQLVDLDTGGALFAPADFCVCQDQFKKYQDHYFEGKVSPQAESVMSAIEHETSFITMKAFKNRLYEVQDTAIALDTMIRSQDLSENSVYEVPECSANQLFTILDAIEKEGNCPTLYNRVDHLVNGDFGMKGNFGLDHLKNMLVDLTETVNGNRVFSHGDKLPLRSFYSMQINRVPTSDDIQSIYSFVEEGMPKSSVVSERAYMSNINYQSYLTNGGAITNQEELRKDYQSRMNQDSEMLDALRRSPMFRLLMQDEGAFREDEVVSEIAEEFIMLVMDDGQNEIEEKYFEKAVALGLKGTQLQRQNWPESLENEYVAESDAYTDALLNKANKLLNDPRLIQTALKAQNQKCKEMFDPKNIRQLFCERLNPPEDLVKDRIIPEVMKHFDPERDSMAFAEANNQMFCKRVNKNETSAIYHAFDLDKAYPSFLEQISNGSSKEFSFYNEKVAPVLQEFLGEDTPYTEERKTQLIGKLSAIDGLSEQAIKEITNRPLSDSKVHEQDTLGSMFTESKLKEEGVVANYTLGATEKDRENARIVNQEILAARAEGREVNQDILDKNGYQVRNLRDGTISKNPGIVGRSSVGIRTKPTPTPVPNPKSPIRDRRISSDRDGDRGSEPVDENSFISNETPLESSESVSAIAPRQNRSIFNEDNSFSSTGLGGNLNRQMEDVNGAMDRIQSQINQNGGNEKLDAELSSAQDQRNRLQVANDFEERLSDMRQRQNALSNATSGRSSNGSSTGYTAPGFGGGNSGGSGYMNPYTNSQGVDRFPATDEDRLATGNKLGDESRQGGGSSGGGRGPASAEGGAGGASAGGALSVAPIPGFEGKSVSDCAIPTLYYVLQCYLSDKVFNEWSYLDEFSSEDEVKEARQSPRELVKNLGFEGKAFVVVTPYKKDEKGREQVLVTTYDYVPQMLEDVDKMNDETFRKELLSKILSERWNFLAMRDYAKRTRIIEEQLYVEGDFLGMAEERKLKPMISSTAGELYNNVAKMNLRIQSENKTKLIDLRQKLSSRR